VISEIKINGYFSFELDHREAEEIANDLLGDDSDLERAVELYTFDLSTGVMAEDDDFYPLTLQLSSRAAAHHFAKELLKVVDRADKGETIVVCIVPANNQTMLMGIADKFDGKECLWLQV
jgi:hypothetical protein